jgi:hypothetical protein
MWIQFPRKFVDLLVFFSNDKTNWNFNNSCTTGLKITNQLDAPVIVMGFPMVYKSVPPPFPKELICYVYWIFNDEYTQNSLISTLQV